MAIRLLLAWLSERETRTNWSKLTSTIEERLSELRQECKRKRVKLRVLDSSTKMGTSYSMKHGIVLGNQSLGET